MSKLIYGVGINDSEYQTHKLVDGKRWICPYYLRWRQMICRCYSEYWQRKYPTYKGASVCAEWIKFTNFKKWMENQDWKGKHLDKDILGGNSKVYSPDTCVFITKSLNNFLTDTGAKRGNLKIGVRKSGWSNGFEATCKNPITKRKEYIGHFNDEQSAFEAWFYKKLEIAKLLGQQSNDERLSVAIPMALINKYSDNVIGFNRREQSDD